MGTLRYFWLLLVTFGHFEVLFWYFEVILGTLRLFSPFVHISIIAVAYADHPLFDKRASALWCLRVLGHSVCF